MKTYFCIALMLLLAGPANARDPLYAGDAPLENDDCRLKPLKLAVLEPLGFTKEEDKCEKRWGDPLPDECVIKTYGATPWGTPDRYISPAKSVIEYDPGMGTGKVFEADSFGNKVYGKQIGVVKKDYLTDNLVVYPADNTGVAAYDAKPVQIIEGDKLKRKRAVFDDDCNKERSPFDSRQKSVEVKIFQPNNSGELDISPKVSGGAVIECEH